MHRLSVLYVFKVLLVELVKLWAKLAIPVSLVEIITVRLFIFLIYVFIIRIFEILILFFGHYYIVLRTVFDILFLLLFLVLLDILINYFNLFGVECAALDE